MIKDFRFAWLATLCTCTRASWFDGEVYGHGKQDIRYTLRIQVVAYLRFAMRSLYQIRYSQ